MIMKYFATGIVLMLLISCSQQPVQEDKGKVFTDMEKLNSKIETLREIVNRLSEDIKDRLSELDKKDQNLLSELRQTQKEIADVQRDFQDLLKVASKSTTPAGSNSNSQPVLQKPEEVRMRALKALEQLQTTHWVDDAAAVLLTNPEITAPIVSEELKRAANPQRQAYMNDLVRIIARYPEKYSIDIVEKSITSESAFLRMAAIDIVKSSGSNSLSQVVEKFMDKFDEYTKYTIAESLVFCKNKAGIAVLLNGLSTTDMGVRLLAIQALKSRATDGESFGYRFELPPDSPDNTAAIKKWLEWWEANKDKLWANQ